MSSFLLLLIVGLAYATTGSGFHDTTCKRLRCTKPEMTSVNQAKMLGLGNHTCVENYVKFSPNGAILSTLTYTSTVDSRYVSSTGSLHSVYHNTAGTTTLIDEYCDGKGNVCIEQSNPDFAGYYTESIDQNKEGLGTTWRSIGYYTMDAKKKIKAIQHFVPTEYGDILTVSFLDADNKLDYTIYQTCTKVN